MTQNYRKRIYLLTTVFVICVSIVIITFIELNSFKKALKHVKNKSLIAGSKLERRIGRIHNVSSLRRSCCSDFDCLIKDKKQYAVLTTLRSDEYFPLLVRFSCSFKMSNPNTELIVATVRGDLSRNVLKRIKLLSSQIRLIFWEELKFDNYLQKRYSLNWVKIRAWTMTEYDAIVMVDADMIILRNINHLFSLPTSFAGVLDEDKTIPVYSSLGSLQGGLIFLRPCLEIADHMVQLLTSNEVLRFSSFHGEQDFFDWYFRYERLALPVQYNSIQHLLLKHFDSINNKTVLMTRGGIEPIIVHDVKKIYLKEFSFVEKRTLFDISCDNK